jgi:hypothetical protein
MENKQEMEEEKEVKEEEQIPDAAAIHASTAPQTHEISPIHLWREWPF